MKGAQVHMSGVCWKSTAILAYREAGSVKATPKNTKDRLIHAGTHRQGNKEANLLAHNIFAVRAKGGTCEEGKGIIDQMGHRRLSIGNLSSGRWASMHRHQHRLIARTMDGEPGSGKIGNSIM
jgi:hypothetical protein